LTAKAETLEEKAAYKMEKAERNKRNIYKNLIDQRKQKHEGFDQSKDITDS
jgi:hypothetical protein